MHPELFEIPFTDLTVKSYGLMMVIGFLAAMYLIRHLGRNITPDPQMITNAALYSLIAGVFGARLFYVVHYFDKFRANPLSVFAIWEGGLELLGGVLLAIIVIFAYLLYHKLPVRRYLDILAVSLMLALAFGRIGCLLNGCCFGRPSEAPWAVRFPYASPAYHSQIQPNLERNRPDPQLDLPAEFFEYYYSSGESVKALKPYEVLTQPQKYMVDQGPYRCLPVHPTQLYSSANGVLWCLVLYLFWKRTRKKDDLKEGETLFLRKPGSVFALMFVFYGISRFFIEFVRDDNPFEFDGLTVSQNISIGMVLLGLALIAVFSKMKLGNIQRN